MSSNKKNWQKTGLVFNIKKYMPSYTHAQVPTPLVCDDCIRVYFSYRPKFNLSLTSYVEFEKSDFFKIRYVHKRPLLELGSAGTFDEFGIMPSCAVREGELVYLYYSGWARSVNTPYHNATGLAISSDGGKTFQKAGKGPILDRTLNEPFSATSPFVLKDGGRWHMWYASGLNWIKINNHFEHTYTIKYANSKDGIEWQRDNIVAVEQKDPLECTVRPSVLKIKNQYHMWFCYRGSKSFRGGKDSYKIGFATSENFQDWKRDDNASGVGTSTSGFDSEMIGYPYVFPINGRLYMLYNGNGFGREGFGLAYLNDWRDNHE